MLAFHLKSTPLIYWMLIVVCRNRIFGNTAIVANDLLIISSVDTNVHWYRYTCWICSNFFFFIRPVTRQARFSFDIYSNLSSHCVCIISVLYLLFVGHDPTKYFPVSFERNIRERESLRLLYKKYTFGYTDYFGRTLGLLESIVGTRCQRRNIETHLKISSTLDLNASLWFSTHISGHWIFLNRTK